MNPHRNRPRCFRIPARRQAARHAGMALLTFTGTVLSAAAQETNLAALSQPPMPDVGLSLIRVMGALALVLGLFLGFAWVYRNWQRLTLRTGHAPHLRVLETRSLGGRYSLFVVGYDQERFLIASSPTGVNLLSHLQPATESPEIADTTVPASAPTPSFAQSLTRILGGQQRAPAPTRPTP